MAAQKKSFEALYGQLEDTTRQLEQGNLSLEDSIKLYERGAGLVEELRLILDEAELHVKTLQVRLQPSAGLPDLGDDDEPQGALSGSDEVESEPDVEVFEYEDDLTDD